MNDVEYTCKIASLSGPSGNFEAAFVGADKEGLNYFYKDGCLEFFFTLIVEKKSVFKIVAPRTKREFGHALSLSEEAISNINPNVYWMINHRRLSDLSCMSEMNDSKSHNTYEVTFDWGSI